ncbi:MAG: Mpo1-like protein [Sphingobacteriaceae bacterium]
MKEKRFQSLKEFYPFYLTEHSNATSRRLHFMGTALVLLLLPASLLFHNARLLILIPFVGYGFAWVGHFFFEKNKPATFQYPTYSLASDFLLFFDLLTGKQKFKP